MNFSPLESLHREFAHAILNRTYIGPVKGDPNKLEHTNKKNIRMAEVFRIAREKIEASLKGKEKGLHKEIAHLCELQKDGETFYLHYQKSTNTWTRWFLKGLSHYTPNALKKILPAFFSNKIERAEQETMEEFQEYQNLIRDKIEELSESADLESSLQSNDSIFGIEEDDDVPVENDKKPSQLEKPKTKPKPEPKKAEPEKEGSASDLTKEKELQEIGDKRLKRFEKIDFDGNDNGNHDELQENLKELIPQSSNPPSSKFSKSEKDSLTEGGEDYPDSPNEDHTNSPNELEITFEDFDVASDEGNPFEEFEEASSDESLVIPLLSPSVEEEASLVDASPASEDIVQAQQLAITHYSEVIRLCKQTIDQFENRPLSLEKFRKYLARMTNTISELAKIDSNAQQTLEKLKIDDKLFAALNHFELKNALFVGNDEKALELLKSTPWHAFFNEAMNQKEYIKFGIRTILKQKGLVLSTENGKPFKEGEFHKYRGQVKINLINTLSIDEIKEFAQFLDKVPGCCPYSLVISIKENESLTPELFELMLKLKNRIDEIKIEGLKELNFRDLAVAEESLSDFVQNLDSFRFPQLEHIVLSDRQKDWKASDFSSILALCPTMEVLKDCYRFCSDYQGICLPSILRQIKELNADGFSIDQIPHLLKQITNLSSLALNGFKVTDRQLISWMKWPALSKLRTLHLNDCSALTTDILVVLSKLPQLTRLTLPNLRKGNLSLDKLPKSDNPFKIKMLYTSSTETQPLVASLYIGPQNWTPVFQIPLARAGLSNIFASNQKCLEPKSVAYWLHRGDYKFLEPQRNISIVLADSNAGLHDGNLVEFMQKFPNAKTLSLYDCPNVTDSGIIQLLQACPNIKNLDLTGCSNITGNLLLGEGPLPFFNQIKKMILTGTRISPDVIEKLEESIKAKLEFKNTNLQITNDDLTDDDALEELLNARDLTQLRSINLENCEKLTDAMLGKLLDRLNIDILIPSKNGTLIDNPQRLNLAVLNLKGCSRITDKAFDSIQKSEQRLEEGSDQAVKSKIAVKLLESLDRVIIGGTNISEVLTDVYPNVIFQESDKPITIQIDPNRQLQTCIDYHQKKMRGLSAEGAKELKKLGSEYMHHRTVVELFCEGDDSASEVLEQLVDISTEEFYNISLYFKTSDEADPVNFKINRDLLYSQSSYFLNGFRSGGLLSKNIDVDFTNVHATPEAAHALKDLLYGKLLIEDLQWKTAADLAELIGPHNFKLATSHYKALLNHIHKQWPNPFDLDSAEDMLATAVLLEDEEGKKEYEKKLLRELSKPGNFQKIANLANEYNLTGLQKTVARIQNDKTLQLIEKEQDYAEG